jgi:hypothetical protein
MRLITIKRAGIGHTRRMRHYGKMQRIGSITPFRSSADYIINTFGYDFRKAQAQPITKLEPNNG